tara:strand:- start:181 stop:624 length:444 start_codon:yes stop_codon:yes gene_type:complete
MTNEDAAYIAGLFDGEGSIYYAKRKEKKKAHKGDGYRYSMSQRISMEVTMTDESVIRWMHEVLGVGTVNKKPRKGRRKDGTKYLMQYRWRCTFRDAYYVCCLIWPFAHTKLPKIQQVLNHYSKQSSEKSADVVNIEEYKMRKEMMFE